MKRIVNISKQITSKNEPAGVPLFVRQGRANGNTDDAIANTIVYFYQQYEIDVALVKGSKWQYCESGLIENSKIVEMQLRVGETIELKEVRNNGGDEKWQWTGKQFGLQSYRTTDDFCFYSIKITRIENSPLITEKRGYWSSRFGWIGGLVKTNDSTPFVNLQYAAL